MTLLETIAKLLRLGPKPEERRRCRDCKYLGTNDQCVNPIAKIVVAQTKYSMIYRIPFWFEERRYSGKCGPAGKYWEDGDV